MKLLSQWFKLKSFEFLLFNDKNKLVDEIDKHLNNKLKFFCRDDLLRTVKNFFQCYLAEVFKNKYGKYCLCLGKSLTLYRLKEGTMSK